MNNNFDSKATTWDTPDKIARAKVFADKIRLEIAPQNNLSALEYGAGTGLVSFWLKNDFAKIILADNSEGMLNEAQQKINSSSLTNLSVMNLDLTKESLDERFDVIYSLLTMHHIQNTEQILAKFYEHLTPNGKIIIADLDSEDGSFHGVGFDGHNGFARLELVSIAQRVGFRDIHVEKLTEIDRHDLGRKYSVFVLVAQK